MLNDINKRNLYVSKQNYRKMILKRNVKSVFMHEKSCFHNAKKKLRLST